MSSDESDKNPLAGRMHSLKISHYLLVYTNPPVFSTNRQVEANIVN